MSSIDTINQMRQRGYSDSEIITQLQQQGISPREINDSLNKSNIKRAVSDPVNLESTQDVGYGEQMQPSVISGGNYEEPAGGNFQPTTQEYSPNEYGNPTNYDNPGFDQQYDQNYDQGYENYGNYGGDYGYGAGYGASSNNLAAEMANQIVSEKIQKTNEQISSLIEFKSLLTTKVEKLDERLKQIESIIDQLQMSIMRKANDQEQNISDIKSEMRAMQSSFGKLVNPLTDTIRDMEESLEKHHHKKKVTKKKR